MDSLVKQIEQKYLKKAVVEVQSGDIVKVHQKIIEGNKERVQIFEGMVIRVDRRKSLSYRITVRKVASGVGVEKGFMMHAPNIVKVEVVKRSKVRRNYLTYIRSLTGKSAKLAGVDFDSDSVNAMPEPEVEDSSAADAPEAPTKPEIADEEPKKEKVEEAKEAKEA